MADLSTLLARPDPVGIAPQLIGAELISTLGGTETSVFLTEVEAYFAPADQASHARNGTRTARTEVFYGPPGHCYLYTIHTHVLINVVTGPVGTPHAILFRAGAPGRGLATIQARRGMDHVRRNLTTGPGVLAKALGLTDLSLYGSDLADPAAPLRLAWDGPLPPEEIVASPRIGLGVLAGEWATRPWRFTRRGSPYVTPARRGGNAK